MKRTYEAPELELIRLTLKDVILGSPLESSISENIDPGNPDDPINLDDL